VAKAKAVVRGFYKRWQLLKNLDQYTTVFIHREATPLGPAWFEKRVVNKPHLHVVYDYDDAIWIPNISKSNQIAKGLKNFEKIPKILSWVDVVAAGNAYLSDFALASGAHSVTWLPTVVDMEKKYHVQHVSQSTVCRIGWTGSHSTLPYLHQVLPILDELAKMYTFKFVVIADKAPAFSRPYVEFLPWNPQKEIADLNTIDIGLMPLVADAWSEGKCGFKLIQYLSIGIPAIASPVGVNKDIIDDGVNGFLVNNHEEWYQAIKRLLEDADLRRRMGQAGKTKMWEHYSLQAHQATFLSLLK
jgi:glycosyltransferase involved in cell wall biosynthesis